MRRVKKLVLFTITIVFMAGCVKKADNTDITVEKSAVKAVETNESVDHTQNNTKIYMLKVDRDGFIPQIIMNETDKTFSFSYDILSSYLAVGTYSENNEQLELKTEDGKYHYTFDIIDDNTLKFNQENSSDIKLIYKGTVEEIKDGSEFIMDSSDTCKD